MIRLVATDIDGTLVKDSSPKVYKEMIDVIKKLTKKGIIFVVASGRTYDSIKNMFREVEEDIVYVAENGAHINYKGKNLLITEMEKQHTSNIIKQMRYYRDTCDFVVSTPTGSILETKNEEFIALIRDGYHNKYKVVEDVLKLEQPIIKVALYQKKSIRVLGEDILIPAWKNKVKTCMAGEEWVDFMDSKVDKGNALLFLQDFFGVKKEETMAFGDNSNDIGLMKAAGESYAVENAREEVKDQAKYVCMSYHNKGVYQILKELL
ncbi:MAG TPA: HAD family hydrolase [Lachnospiraceae bacterium]|nr:HAD family hydrolase [Lachnospiraceae bacterium]